MMRIMFQRKSKKQQQHEFIADTCGCYSNDDSNNSSAPTPTITNTKTPLSASQQYTSSKYNCQDKNLMRPVFVCFKSTIMTIMTVAVCFVIGFITKERVLSYLSSLVKQSSNMNRDHISQHIISSSSNSSRNGWMKMMTIREMISTLCDSNNVTSIHGDDNFCLTTLQLPSKDWFDTVTTRYARPWNVRPYYTWWRKRRMTMDYNSENNCTTTDLEKTDGLFFIKVPKSASSTVVGTLLNLQHYYDHYSKINNEYNNDDDDTKKLCSDNSTTNPSSEKPTLHWQHGKANTVLSSIPVSSNSNNQPGKQLHTTTQNRKNTKDSASSNTYILAPIRLPHARALSHVYYYTISFHRNTKLIEKQQQQQIPKDSFIIKHLQNDIIPNSILDYVNPLSSSLNASSSSGTREQQQQETIESIFQSIMETYDYFLITERMDESLVVLSYLLSIPIQYFVTLSSKQSSSWYHTGEKKPTKKNKNKTTYNPCIQLVSPIVTDNIEQHVQSKEWIYKHLYDYVLYDIANRSLDLTIDFINKQLLTTSTMSTSSSKHKTVKDMVQQLQKMRRHVEEQCILPTKTIHNISTSSSAAAESSSALYFYYNPPCSSTGIAQIELSKQSCHERDFGCGHYCVATTLQY